MSFAEYLYNLVDIIVTYAVKEHYTDNCADCDQLEEIKRVAKDLSKYSPDYEAVYIYDEEVQEYIMKKIQKEYEKEKI